MWQFGPAPVSFRRGRRIAGGRLGWPDGPAAELLAYIDVSWTPAIVGAVMIPVALTIRSVDLSAPLKGQ